MKYYFVILSLASLANCQQSPSTSVPDCDFSLNTVKSLRDREETFRNTKAVDPTDNSKKLTRYSTYVSRSGISSIRIKIDDLISEDYKTDGNNIITQKGQFRNKTDIINYELTADGYKFQQIPTGNTFSVPVKSLDSELPSSVKLEDNYKTTFNTIIALRKKLYAVKAIMEKENPNVKVYSLNPAGNGYFVQYYETNQGLSENSEGSKITGRYKCGPKIQDYSVIKGDVQLVGEPKALSLL